MSEIDPSEKIGIYARQLFFLAEKLAYPNVFLDQIFEKLKQMEKDSLIDEVELRRSGELIIILLDKVVVHLYSLIEIKKKLNDTLKKIGREDLDYSLRFLWKPVEDMENKIRMWRNYIVAHLKFQFHKFRTLPEVDPEYDKTVPRMFFVSRLACHYIDALLVNLKIEMFIEMTKEVEERRKEKQFFVFMDFEEKNKEVEKILEKTKMELRKNRYDDQIGLLYGEIKKRISKIKN